MLSPETEILDYESAVVYTAEEVKPEFNTVLAVFDPQELAFELGVWLMGIRGFAHACRDAFATEPNSSIGNHDRSREFRIFNSALLITARLNFRLRKSVSDHDGSSPGILDNHIDVVDLDDLAADLREMIVLNESIMSSTSKSDAEWRSWSSTVEQRLASSGPAKKLAAFVFESGELELPSKLNDVFRRPSIELTAQMDFQDIVPRVGVILRCLDMVGSMLRNDKPLKPALVIFAAIYQQTRKLIEDINNRLARFPDEGSPIFSSLDNASYGASLELKKVFRQELRGIVMLLPPPSVHAHIETAYSLLLDSFQQMLIELARAVDENVSPFDFFPRYQLKLEQSIMLREHLWRVFKTVQAAEQDPEGEVVAELCQELSSFLGSTLSFLHYKDGETLERFSEEVHAARDKRDLVPILHRFGAYLETLFGQICMRAVLAGHPFEESDQALL